MLTIEGRKTHFEIQPYPQRPKKGTESLVQHTNIVASRASGKTRKLKDKFIIKEPLASLVVSRHLMKTGAREFTKEESREAVKEWHQKFVELKKVNSGQPDGAHKFNLPQTVRIAKNEDGSTSLLISNLKIGGTDNYIDLREAENYCFSQQDAENIRTQILADMELSQQHHINLSFENNFYPLDTWAYLKKEGKVVIVDVAERVRLNSTEEDIKNSSANVSSALSSLRVSTETKLSPRLLQYDDVE